jgi:DNA (cytosine-5)-methyltransferase 1
VRAGSLFAGFGGLDLAVHDALGATTAWVAEVDPGACRVLAHRFPGAPNHGDVTAIDWTGVESVEVTVAGYPCPGESNAGKRLGDKDPRWLWPAYRDAIAVLRPRLAIGENVRAHVGRSFRHVVADLQTLGYAAAWVVVSAADVGACHLRERVFWAAWPQEYGPPQGLGRHAFAWLQDGVMTTPDLFGGSPCVTWPVAGAAYAGAAYVGAAYVGAGPVTGLLPTVRTTDAQGAGAHGDGGLDLRTAISLLPTPDAGAFNDGEDLDAWLARRDRLRETGVNGNGMGTPPSIAVRLLPTPDAGHGRKDTRTGPLLAGAVELLPTPLGAQAGHGSEAPRLVPTPLAADAGIRGGTTGFGLRDWSRSMTQQPERWGQFAAAVSRWEALTRPAPEPTVPGKNGNPKLNPAFAEWMMGAPAGWITDVPGVTRTQALKLAGNGVVRQQGAAAIRWLAGQLPAGVLPARFGEEGAA